MTERHLSDEQVSALVDGMSEEVSDGVPAGEHLEGCRACRQRLVTFEAARDLVRTPVPPMAPDLRAASIATVLRGAREGTEVAPGADTRVVPMRYRVRPRVLAGSAAAVLVVATAVAVPLALSGSGTSATSSVASRSAASAHEHASKPSRQSVFGTATTGTSAASAASGAAGLAASAAAGVAELGSVGSVGALRTRVAALQGTAAVAQPSSAASQPDTAPEPSAAPSDGSATPSTAVPGAAVSSFEHCLPAASGAAGTSRTIARLATATVGGTPVLVFVFNAVTTGSPTGAATRGIVVATVRDGCRVLGTTTL